MIPKVRPRPTVRRTASANTSPSPSAESSGDPNTRSREPSPPPALPHSDNSSGGQVQADAAEEADDRAREQGELSSVAAVRSRPASAERAASPPVRPVTKQASGAMASQAPVAPPRITPRSSQASSPTNTQEALGENAPGPGGRDPSSADRPTPPAAPVRRFRSATMRAPSPRKQAQLDVAASPDISDAIIAKTEGTSAVVNGAKVVDPMDFTRGSELRSTPPRKPERTKASYRASPSPGRRDLDTPGSATPDQHSGETDDGSPHDRADEKRSNAEEQARSHGSDPGGRASESGGRVT